MATVKFVNDKKEIQVPEGTNLRKAALAARVNLYNGINGIGSSVNKILNCHGLGLCGTCVVTIAKGMENTSKMGVRERLAFKGIPTPGAALHYIGNEGSMRLACMTRVNGDVEVITKPDLNLFGENFFS